jgi:iron(III) transport system substrate-binding protein
MLKNIEKNILIPFMLLAACIVLIGRGSAEPPGLARLTGAEKDRVAKLIEGAKREGELTGYVSTLRPDVLERMIPDFQKEFGFSESDLKIKLVSARTATIVTKVTEELRAKVYKTDIVSTAPAYWFDELIARKEIMAYDSPEYKHFHPLVTNPKLGQANPPYYISGYNNLWAIAYNPKYVKEEILHWKDVLRPEYKGKIVCLDPTQSFSTADAYLALRKIVGKSFFEELGKLKPFLLASGSDAINKCVSGEYPINVFGTSILAFRANEKGAGIKMIFPPEGFVVVGYPAAILARAPHPNAAKLFMDYYHGESFQNVFLNIDGVAVGRLGIKSKHEFYPKPIYEIKGAIEMDWTKITKRDRQEAVEEFRKLVKEAR